MCGICGVAYSDRQRVVERRFIERMTRQIAHRGPDSAGVCVQGNAGLGARRLAIVDLAGGQQPLSNATGSITVVFNGELYNYRALTRTLQQRGHRFRTQSDTEVLVHAYEEFGDRCLEQLNGMFAFALWDRDRQRLLLGRDRLGIKPLYYAQHDGGLYFGSELKALLADPHLPRHLDRAALNEYLSFEYVPTPRTIFQNVWKLPPGSALSYANGQVQRWQYWDIDLAQSERRLPHCARASAAELRAVFAAAVQQETTGDVPLGVLLSGGIDSSAVAAMLTAQASAPVKSFSIRFEDRSFDESHYARAVAQHLGTEHHELTLTSSMALELVPKLGHLLDEPLADSSFVPTYWLAQFARQQVKVVLGGDGGDEIFAGYSTLQAHRLLHYYDRLLPGAARHQLAPWLVERLPVSFNNLSLDFKLRRFIAGSGQPAIARHHQWLGSFTPAQKQRLLQSWVQDAGAETYAIAGDHQRRSQARDPLNQLLYCDLKLYLEGGILTKVDRASMANALEVRVPFLNQTLVEYAAQLPHSFKLRGLTPKYILRRALRGTLPRAILQRRKKGFNMPVAKWLAGDLQPLLQDMLAADRLQRQGLFEPTYVQQLLGDHLKGRADHRKLLWTLLVFQLWHEQWQAA